MTKELIFSAKVQLDIFGLYRAPSVLTMSNYLELKVCGDIGGRWQ